MEGFFSYRMGLGGGCGGEGTGLSGETQGPAHLCDLSMPPSIHQSIHPCIHPLPLLLSQASGDVCGIQGFISLCMCLHRAYVCEVIK